MIIEILALLAVVHRPPEHALVDRYNCSSNHAATEASIEDVNAAYSWRSIAILRAALAGDRVRLANMVAPTATFTVSDGDAGWGPRAVGVEAAVRFARHVSPRGFQFALASAGPISVAPCQQITVEILLRGNDPYSARSLSLTYQSGLLIRVEGRMERLETGEFRDVQ